jgi:regulatory protein
VAPRTSSRGAPGGSAAGVAVRLIAQRDHSRAEIRRKLLRRGFGPAEVEAAEAQLIEHGLLSDRAFAHLYVRRRSSSHGPLAISAELAARGVDRETADEAVRLLGAGVQLAAARRLADRLAGDTRYASYRELLGSVGPKLLRRGFSTAVARAACDGVWEGTAESPEA